MAAAAMDPELLALMGELGQLTTDAAEDVAAAAASASIPARAPVAISVSERVAMDVLALLRDKLGAGDDLSLYATRAGDSLITHVAACARVRSILHETPIIPIFAYTHAAGSDAPSSTCLSDLVDIPDEALHRVVAHVCAHDRATLYNNLYLASAVYLPTVVCPAIVAAAAERGHISLPAICATVAPHVPAPAIYDALHSYDAERRPRLVTDFNALMASGDVYFLDAGVAYASVLYSRAYVRTLIARSRGAIAAISSATPVSSLPCDEPRLEASVTAFVLSRGVRHSHVLSGTMITPRGHEQAVHEVTLRTFLDTGVITLPSNAVPAFAALAQARVHGQTMACVHIDAGNVVLFLVQALVGTMHAQLSAATGACLLSQTLPPLPSACAETIAGYILRRLSAEHADVATCALQAATCAVLPRATHAHVYVHPSIVLIPVTAIRDCMSRLEKALSDAVDASLRELAVNARAAADGIVRTHVNGPSIAATTSRAARAGPIAVTFTRVPLLTLAAVRRQLRVPSTPAHARALTVCAEHIRNVMYSRYEGMRACVDAAAGRAQLFVNALSRVAVSVHDDTAACACVAARDAVLDYVDGLLRSETREWPDTAQRIPAAQLKAVGAAVEVHLAREQVLMDACVKSINKLAKAAAAAPAVDALCVLLQRTHAHRIVALVCIHVAAHAHIPLPPHVLHALVPPEVAAESPRTRPQMLSLDDLRSLMRGLDEPRDASDDATVPSKRLKAALRRAVDALSSSDASQPLDALTHVCNAVTELLGLCGIHVGVYTHKEEKELLAKCRGDVTTCLTSIWHASAAPAQQAVYELNADTQAAEPVVLPRCTWMGTHSGAAAFALAAAVGAADALRAAPAVDAWVWDETHVRSCPAWRAVADVTDLQALTAAASVASPAIATLLQQWTSEHVACVGLTACPCSTMCTRACQDACGNALAGLAAAAHLHVHATSAAAVSDDADYDA